MYVVTSERSLVTAQCCISLKAHDTPVTLTFKRIVCGVDFSPMSEAALLSAAELARPVKAELHVVHVIETYAHTPNWVLEESGVDIQTLELTAATAMDALVTKWSAALESIPMTTEITTGLAAVELVNRVRDGARDLIVVGARGARLLEDAFVGGTAEQVVKEARCSVLVVRDQPRI